MHKEKPIQLERFDHMINSTASHQGTSMILHQAYLCVTITYEEGVSMKKEVEARLSEENVKQILRNKDKILEKLEQRKNIYYVELKKGMEAYAIPSSPIFDGMPHGSGWQNDLSDLILRADDVYDKAVHELCDAVEEINEIELLIDRVWKCYAALPDPYFLILQVLYVKGELYSEAVKIVDVSKSLFEINRKHGIERLIQYCESDLTLAELIRYGQNPRYYEKADLISANTAGPS